MIHTFYNGSTAVDATGVVEQINRHHEYGTFQVAISDTATVTLEGSLNNSDWFLLATKTASDLIVVALTPYMRTKITSYTSGTVRAFLAE